MRDRVAQEPGEAMSKNTPRFGNFERLAYGSGELGPAMAGSTIIFFQLVFLTDVAGMNPGLAGSVLLIARIWDAVNDPLIGWLSDHTKTPWGRRLPWMVVSAVPFSAFFLMFWLVPDFAGPERNGNISATISSWRCSSARFRRHFPCRIRRSRRNSAATTMNARG